jgi:hypothetical protein
MDLLRNFLINAIYYIKLIFRKPDYKIIEKQLEYWVDHEKDYVTSDEFWEKESDDWYEHTSSYYTRIMEDGGVPPPPEVVTKLLIRVKYWYNNHIYKFLTYDHDYQWPPVYQKGVQFSIPLSSAQLLDVGGTPVKDILGKIKRYAGPRGDFYGGQRIKIGEMFYYDEETLKELYPKIILKNVFGITKTVCTTDGYINDLRIP